VPYKLFGLPTHVLLVHATVVLLPLAVLAVVAAVASGRLRERLGVATPGLAVAALVLVPLTTGSGEELQRRVTDSALVRRHVQLADGLLPFVAVLAVSAVALHLVRRRRPAPGPVAASSVSGSATAVLVLSVLAVAAGVATTVQVVRIGHSGATAVWQPLPDQPHPIPDRG